MLRPLCRAPPVPGHEKQEGRGVFRCGRVRWPSADLLQVWQGELHWDLRHEVHPHLRCQAVRFQPGKHRTDAGPQFSFLPSLIYKSYFEAGENSNGTMRRKENSDGSRHGCSAQLATGVSNITNNWPKMEQFSCRYQQLLASCSNITYHKYNENGNTGYIEATDCVNGTWFQNGEMARVDYETLLVNYERYRTDRSRMVVGSSADPVSLIPWEEDITILNDVGLCWYIKFKVSV